MLDRKKQRLAIAVLENANQQFKELAKTEPWRFDPQEAVDLLFDKSEPDFPFQKALYLYLFLIWCIKPTTKSNTPTNLRPVAAAAALRLTFSVTNASGTLTDSSFTGIGALSKRLTRDWYKNLDKHFISRVGGLANAVNAPSLSSEDVLRLDRYENQKRALGIIKIIVGLMADKHSITNKLVLRAFQTDVLNEADDFYRPVGEMRKKALAAKQMNTAKGRRDLPETTSPSGFRKLWKPAPKTIILLFVLQDVLGTDTNFFSDKRLLQRLEGDRQLHQRLRAALQLYGAIVAQLKNHPDIDITAEWSPIVVPPPKRVKLPKFDQAQRVRLKLIS